MANVSVALFPDRGSVRGRSRAFRPLPPHSRFESRPFSLQPVFDLTTVGCDDVVRSGPMARLRPRLRQLGWTGIRSIDGWIRALARTSLTGSPCGSGCTPWSSGPIGSPIHRLRRK